MKVGFVCADGGHLTQVLLLLEEFGDTSDFFIATYKGARESYVSQFVQAYFINNIGRNIFRMLGSVIWVLRIMLVEKPGVIISLGSEISLPFFLWAKLLRKKTIYIESWSRMENLSRTGQMLYPYADIFLVQWEDLLDQVGPKAQYQGAIL